MSPPDTNALDVAIVALLRADAALRTLAPDGVYFDEAPPGSKRYVIVQLVDSQDVPTFDDAQAMLANVYGIKAVMLSSANGNPAQAANRIDAVMRGADDSLTVPGFDLIDVSRDLDQPRIRYTEVDPDVPDVRYFHRGGQYRITVAPAVNA